MIYSRMKIAFIAALPASAPISLAADSSIISVRDTGAVDDGKTANTLAFQKALDAAAKIGGEL